MSVWESFGQGMRLGDAMRTRSREDQQRQAYGQAFQSGGFGGVAQTAGGMGDLETAGDAQTQARQQEESQLSRARQNGQVLQRVHASLAGVPAEERAARLAQIAPGLEQYGVAPEMLQNVDTSDQGWAALGEELNAALGQFQRFQDLRVVDGVGLVGINADGSTEVLQKESPQPGPTFQILAPDVAQQQGLAPGSYQQNTQTGRVEPINTQRGSPLERAQASADVERINTFRQGADTDAATIMELNRFEGLNDQETGTGPNNPQNFALGTWRPLANENTQQMVQIISRLTPQQRVPGSGATSDFDARMFQEALPGINRSEAANDAIIRAYQTRAQLSNERVNIAEAWLESGSLSGLDGVWRRYVNANPIFDPNSTPDNPRVNERRQDFLTWAQANGIEMGAPASATMQQGAPQQQAPQNLPWPAGRSPGGAQAQAGPTSLEEMSDEAFEALAQRVLNGQ